MIKSLKSGFTLAEVLTTLMVIGVVAAMTIPTLLNSTNEQQSRVAAKKAMSVLSQGAQLLFAKEENCTIDAADADSSLATCMKKVISGDVNGNRIVANDGMVYYFFAKTGSGAADEDRTFETVCGTERGTSQGGGACGVLVDTNGGAKETKTADLSSYYSATNTAKFNASGFVEDPQRSNDVVAFGISQAGAYPLAFPAGTNRTYKYITGNPAGDGVIGAVLCCAQDHVVADPNANPPVAEAWNDLSDADAKTCQAVRRAACEEHEQDVTQIRTQE